MQITITGRTPSKKNSKVMICRGKRPILLPSNKYKEWHEDAMVQLMEQDVPKDKVKFVEMIAMTIYAPDKRKADMTNKAESIMDLLVDYGFISDDNWFVCPDIQLLFGGVDRENPRIEITIGE